MRCVLVFNLFQIRKHSGFRLEVSIVRYIFRDIQYRPQKLFMRTVHRLWQLSQISEPGFYHARSICNKNDLILNFLGMFFDTSHFDPNTIKWVLDSGWIHDPGTKNVGRRTGERLPPL